MSMRYCIGTSANNLAEFADELNLTLTTQNVSSLLRQCAKSHEAGSSEVALFPAYACPLVSEKLGYLIVYVTDSGMLDWVILVTGGTKLVTYQVLQRADLDITPWDSAQFVTIFERLGKSDFDLEQARAFTEVHTQFIALQTFHVLDTDEEVRKFNDVVADLDLSYIDDLTLKMQLSSVIYDIRDTIEGLGIHLNSASSTTRSASSAATSSTKGTPVEQSTKGDLARRMMDGEGTFVWTMQNGSKSYGYIIEIIYDYSARKLRARTDDGRNGIGWVAFPNSLRKQDAVYFVKKNALTFNGKNYRVSNANDIILIP